MNRYNKLKNKIEKIPKIIQEFIKKLGKKPKIAFKYTENNKYQNKQLNRIIIQNNIPWKNKKNIPDIRRWKKNKIKLNNIRCWKGKYSQNTQKTKNQRNFLQQQIMCTLKNNEVKIIIFS